jgi:SAM-dependent methyltransferase
MTGTPPIPFHNFNMKQFADNIFLSDDGIWSAANHDDFKFIENDETDWLLIEQTSFWYVHRNRCYHEFLKLFPPKGILFEIGAGNGSVTLALQEAGFSIVAIEPTVKLARHAKLRGVEHVICANIKSAKFKKGALENVGMFDVLEHIQEDEAFLADLHDLMPPGGRFYCAIPAIPLLWSKEDEAAEHVRRYTISSLCRCLVRAGFKIEYSTYYFNILFIPVLIFRALPSLLGLRSHRTHKSSFREHHIKSRYLARLLEYFLNQEIKKFRKGGKRQLGTSCIVISSAN